MSLELTPAELRLPDKFNEFRPQQLMALERIAQTDKKVVLCQAPTGSGKTLLMAALGRHLETQLIYTCHTKQLQQQVVDDFPYGVELKGRSNYPCIKSNNLTCNECTRDRGNSSPTACKVCEFKGCGARPHGRGKKAKASLVDKCPCDRMCYYLQQKRLARASELAILNTPFFLNEANFAGDFSGWPWVVLDEGDQTENSLMSFIELIITKTTIARLRLEPPAKKTVEEAWLTWAKELAIPTIQQRLADLGLEEDKAKKINPFAIREKKGLERLLYKLLFFVDQDLRNWAFIPDENQWTWKPVFISRYAQHYLWRHGERFLVMSATIISPRQFARDLGLKPDDVEFIDLPSVFPPERRPVYYIPCANMTRKNKETAWPQMVRAMDRIIAEHPQSKGLVHTVSYPLARYIHDNSQHKARLIQHDPSNRISTLGLFKADPGPLVLISPSMERGVDLPGDLCQFIVILKVPFPNLGDIQVSRRLYSADDGNLWYAVQTVRSIVQATGRGMRSAEDFCESYILDEQFGRLFKENYGLFPTWWKQALRRTKE